MTDAGNEIWKFGGRENKEWSDRRLEESAAGVGVSLSKFLHRPPPQKKKKNLTLLLPAQPHSLYKPLTQFCLFICVFVIVV